MTFIQRNAVGLVAIVIAIVAIGMIAGSHESAPQQTRGVTNYDEVDATALKIGGSSGSRVGPVIAGIAAIIGNVPMTATSTKSFDIAITGVVSGDSVFASAASSTASSTPTGFVGFSIVGASASSTSGFITITVANMGTSTAVVPNNIASTTAYLVLHPLTSVPGL